MNSPEIQAFIKEQSHLFWHIPEKDKLNISHEVLVEYVFNYGDMDSLKKLIVLIGEEGLKESYSKINGRRKLNFFPEMYNYLTLLVHRNA